MIHENPAMTKKPRTYYDHNFTLDDVVGSMEYPLWLEHHMGTFTEEWGDGLGLLDIHQTWNPQGLASRCSASTRGRGYLPKSAPIVLREIHPNIMVTCWEEALTCYACNALESNLVRVSLFVTSPFTSKYIPPKDKKNIPPADDFMEMFSQARIVPVVQGLGLQAIRSMDKLTGWDLTQKKVVENAMEDFWKRCPAVAMLSPPCTIFSKMQDTNWQRMEPEKLKAQAKEGVFLLNVAIWFAKYQHECGRKFILEHPATAKSWSRDEMKQLMALDGVYQVLFDQCQYGLVSKVAKKPMQKRTILLTNMIEVPTTYQHPPSLMH
jgi:hypothetical protein